MSFYQPSLSLYDILNALSNQAALRRQQEQPYQRRQQQQSRIIPTAFGQGNQGQRRYHEYPTRSYPIQPEAVYYHPVFYGGDDYEEPYPMQSRVPDQSNYLSELLRALTEGDPNNYDTEEAGDEERDDEDGLERGPPDQVPEGNFLVDQEGYPKLGQENNDTKGKNPFVEALKDKVQQALQEDDSSETVRADSTQNQPEESGPADKRSKQSSLPGLEIPSPIPDPLQVSKPQRRLDLPFSPELNVYDAPELYTVVLALPGASSKSFKIDYHPSSHEVLIKGNIDNKIGVDSKYMRISELKYGAFERSVKLPVLPRIIDEDIKATYCNGLLQIKIPKVKDDTSKPQPKRRIVIEDVPDEELVFEENPNPEQPL